MGNSQAKASRYLDEKLAEVIVRKAARRPPSEVKFNKLLLTFPQMRHGFVKCRAVFNAIDTDHSKSVDLQELRAGCRKHGIRLPDDLLVKIFQSNDLDGNHVLDFHEFVVVLAIIYMFQEDMQGTDRASALDADIVKTFTIAQDAFLYFDSSRDGYMQKDEVMAALGDTGTPVAAAGNRTSARPAQSNILARRFEEMDWDKSGQISFKEFLFAVQGWVMEDEEEEEDEANVSFDSLRPSDR